MGVTVQLMFKRIASRTLTALVGQWKMLLVAIVVSVAIGAYVYQRTPQTTTGITAQVLTCDVAIMAAFNGQPGDDNFATDCVSSMRNAPTTAAQMAEFRAQAAAAPTTSNRIGSFASDKEPGAIGITYVTYDHYPETVTTIYLAANGKVLAIQ